jgi:hypothetical protein
LALVVVVTDRLPVDGHDLQRGEQERRVQSMLRRQARDVASDLNSDSVGGDAAWGVG